jgi:hypothetical protein
VNRTARTAGARRPRRDAVRWRGVVRMMAAPLAIAAACHAPATFAAADTPDIPAIMRLTVDRWVATQAEGLLPYGFDFMADTAIEPNRLSASNLIRQTGAAFALARYYEYTKDARLGEPLRNALSAFDRHSLPIRKGSLQRAVEGTRALSLPVGRWKLQRALDRFGLLYEASGSGKVVSPDGKYEYALAGTVALALLTETIYARASGDESFATLRAAWLEGLLSLRIPGGGFRQHPLSIDDTDYDNGEGWLALAVYVDAHRDDRDAAQALADVDDALMRRYAEDPSVYFVGWGNMAIAQRYATTRDARFLRYLQRQADLFFERYEDRYNANDNNCAAMEGLAAALAGLKAGGETDTRRVRGLREWLLDEVRKLPKLQIQPDQRGLKLGGEAYLSAPRMSEYAGAFLSGIYQPLTRVDAAGHCLSAMVTIERGNLSAP